MSRTFLRLGLGKQRGDEVDGSVPFEDPVRRAGEDEEEPEHDLEHLERDLDSRVQHLACLRHLAQPLVDRGEDFVLDALRVGRLLVDLGLGASTESVLHLVDARGTTNQRATVRSPAIAR